MFHHAANLRRIMARDGLTLDAVAQRTGLDLRTIRGLLNDAVKPQARTLHQLAAGLEIDVDELFQNPALLARRLFDRRTNPVVDELTSSEPDLFDGWTSADFDELYSRFGEGGALTPTGARQTVLAMNAKREVLRKAALLLETHEADLLSGLVDMLYRRVVMTD